MTQEEKAKAYDEAIKRAKSKIKNDKDHVLYENDIIDIFPALKESEDEKIRKWLINYFREVCDNVAEKEKNAVLAWIEKQGEPRINDDDKAILENWECIVKDNKEKWQLSDWFVEATLLLVQKIKQIELSKPIVDNNKTMLNACINTLRNVGHSHLAAWLEKQSTPQVRTSLEWVNTIDDACDKRYSEEYAHGEYCHEQSFKWGFQEGVDWFEKQSEQKFIDNLTQQEAMDIAVAKCFEQGEQTEEPIDTTGFTDFEKCFHGMCCDKNKKFTKECCVSLLELARKQILNEQKPVINMKTPEESLDIDSDTYNKIVDECIYGKQKPADKVEPKFHIGDRVRCKDNPHLTYILKRLTDDGDYEFHAIGKDGNEGCTYFTGVKYQDEWELVEQKPAWSEEDKDMLYKAIAVINRLCAEGKDYVWSIKTLKKLFCWFKSLKDRVQPQPKQEWSEEDKNKRDAIIQFIEDNYLSYSKNKEPIEWLDWLKSLRPQNWTKEDKERYISCLQRLSTGNPEQPETINSKWFKEHVYPQSQWKPSDEQIKAIDTAVSQVWTKQDSEKLMSLYKDLKKLKE